MITENPKQILALIKEPINDFMSEAEQIHYFGLCKPDHSDCPFLHCGIRETELYRYYIEGVEVTEAEFDEKVIRQNLLYEVMQL